MNKPDITIPGFNGYDYKDAVEVEEYQKRRFIRECLEVKKDGHYFADAMLASSGDTLILLIRNKRSGQCEMYDLKVRAHYMEQGDFPMTAGAIVKAE